MHSVVAFYKKSLQVVNFAMSQDSLIIACYNITTLLYAILNLDC
jgi:hypothetical protein